MCAETNYGGKYGVRVSYEEGDMVCFESACAGTDGVLRTSCRRQNELDLVCSKTNRPPCALPESPRVMMSNHFSTPPASNRFLSRSPSTYAPPTGGGPFLSLQEAGAAQDEFETPVSARVVAVPPTGRGRFPLCLSLRRRKMFSR